MKFYLNLAALVFLLPACMEKKPYANPPGYDMAKPYVINLPAEIEEISGLTYYGKDKSVFAINDENGILYKITPGSQTKMHRWKFAKQGDFEDLVLHKQVFYILQSNGTIYVVKFTNINNIETQVVSFPFGDKNEFEAMYYDSALNKMIMVCKDCEDEKKKALATFAFDMATRSFSQSPFSIPTKKLAEALGVKKFKFKAAAAAVHPIDGQLYIISSIYKLLIIVGDDGNIKQFYKLSPALFKQAEGLTFSNDGTMIISNEAADVGTANLLIFNYHKPG